MKALEVLLNDKSIGLYIAPEGASISAMVANVPMNYMRAQLLTGNDKENWQWQLPDVKEGDLIAFRLVDASGRTGVPPDRITGKDPKQTQRVKAAAAKAFARSKKKTKTTKGKKKPKRKK
ncbi:MAG: hypothetical protein ACJ8NR_18950 [Sulfurifustis sp.]